MIATKSNTPIHFWFWDKEIPSKTCKKIINLGKGQWETGAVLAGTDTSVRKSEVVWITEQWVYDLIWEYMLGANKQAGWNYNIVAAHSCQVTRYTKDGFYSWHHDSLGSHQEVHYEPDNEFLHGNTRKLSMSIILNSNFEGGDFEIRVSRETPKLGQGSIIVFPSFLEHRVIPVTKGIRYSLVTWFVGPPFV